jgi:Transposase DDE domain
MSEFDTSEMKSVIGKVLEVMPRDELNRMQPSGPATVYTTLATIWMMILQRLGGGLSMEAVVKDAVLHGRDFFPDNKRLREGSLSPRDTAFSNARQRLKIETVTHLLESVSSSLIEAYATPGERPVFIVDGTTLTTAPTDDLKAAFPPAVNQLGESVWPTVLMLVAHELHSGCALVPEIGAMYGDNRTSEARLVSTLCHRLPNDSIVLADSGFGIFGTAWDCIQAGHSIAFRLSDQRFKALLKKATPLNQSGPGESHSVIWRPTAKNRCTNPDLPADAELDVVVHSVPLSEVVEDCDSSKLLHLVTTADISREQAIALYLCRYDVEHDIRDVKVTLNTERIRAQSADMFRKELLTSLVAYNLVIQFRREAAERANVTPRRLSFTSVWNTFQSFFLKLSPATTAEDWTARYERALDMASKDLLRKRSGRSFPRQAHPRRPKTTKFMKHQRKKTKTTPN